MRYAILFSGMSFRRHVNGLEFCYRTLVDLGFATDNIHILNYDASLRAFGDSEHTPCEAWPGDNTAYRMVVSAAGSRAAFQLALRAIREKLTRDDQVFINTTGHGGHHGDGRGPDLITYPHGERYKRRDFCADLATLPPHRSLVVLMAQCFSGGFNHAVVDASRAASTFIASATSGFATVTPIGNPLPSPFALVMMSGVTPHCSMPNHLPPVRPHPVCTSSLIQMPP